MISAAIAARRQKHKILNDSLSIESTDEEGNNICEYLLSDDKSNPETMLLNIEREKDILNKASHILTDFEIQVFELKINGFNYKEISEVLDRDVKAIDNALQRIKTKLKKNIKKVEEMIEKWDAFPLLYLKDVLILLRQFHIVIVYAPVAQGIE